MYSQGMQLQQMDFVSLTEMNILLPFRVEPFSEGEQINVIVATPVYVSLTPEAS